MIELTTDRMDFLDEAYNYGDLPVIVSARDNAGPWPLPVFSDDIRPHEKQDALAEWAEVMGCKGGSFEVLTKIGGFDGPQDTARHFREHGIHITEVIRDGKGIATHFWTAMTEEERKKVRKERGL